MTIAWVAALGLLSACRTGAKTFTTLHYFTSDGFEPGSLVLSGNTLYGTTALNFVPDILEYGNGTLFKVNTDGSNFATLHALSGFPSRPHALTLLDATLFATASTTLFQCRTDGAVFTNLFSSPDGTFSGLLSLGSTLFGTTLGPFNPFNSSAGTVFKIDTDGTGFEVLHDFATINTNSAGAYTNSDGFDPSGGLIISGETLYGTASGGGATGSGTLFRINRDGSNFMVLHNFAALATNESGVYTNTDGAHPQARLILSGSALYGAASDGGTSGSGTIFRVNTDGTGFVNLHDFTMLVSAVTNYTYLGAVVTYTNSDGAHPGGLVFSNDTLYGAARGGGSSGSGTIFAVNTGGAAFTTLYSFTALFPARTNQAILTPIEDVLYTNRDGAFPDGLILAGNTLYGTTLAGGTNGLVGADGGDSAGFGTLFSLSFEPQPTIIPSKGNVVLTWPTKYAGFDYSGYNLQSTTNLSSAAWITNLTQPLVTNGLNTVTNPISGIQQFFQLRQ